MAASTSNPGGVSWAVNLRMPRPWHGMTVAAWLGLLRRGGWRVRPTRLPMAAIISLFSVLNSVLQLQEALIYGWRVPRGRPLPPPLFVLGHWRTGTTLLHELLVQDPQFSSPTTYQVMAPGHFLSTAWFAVPLLSWFLPARRLLDNMLLSLNRPQEDEFALCNLGLPSPYLDWAWPNQIRRCGPSLELDGLPARELARWERAFVRYLERLAFRHGGRLVLKSPPHTARLRTLLRLFPDAQFVHIVRDPYAVVPSTINTWKKMQYLCGLEPPKYEHLEQYVFDVYERMYQRLEADRRLAPPENFCDVKYEELVAAPVATMRRVYEHLRLGDPDAAQPRWEAYLESVKGHRTNRYALSDELRAEIARRWAAYFERYGYPRSHGEPPDAARARA